MKQGMKRGNGFSLIEMMISMIILLVVVAAATIALIQAQHATDGVALMANTQENLRAGMHFIMRDLTQAGEGIPPAGVALPNTTAGVSAVNRPGTATTFPTSYTLLPVVTPGWQLGQTAVSVNPQTGATLAGVNTDVINILYADNTLVDTAGNFLNSYPIVQSLPALPVCGGSFSTTGLTVTLATGCFKMPGTPTPLAVGNLVLFSNQNGTAMEYVTGVAGQVITFGAGDPANLNQTGLPNGTFASLANLASAGGGFPPITLQRVWMVSYYIDSTTNPIKPQLVRQVNYPNYPTVLGATNPAQQIADCIENLSFSFDIINSTAPAGTYTIGPGDAPNPQAPYDFPNQIRAVNVSLFGRSEYPYLGSSMPQYFRNNLETQVSLRSMSFQNQFETASSPTP
jgi:prepilin-type N-terminal cleavage/methylation domain-containing protein